MSRSGWEQTPTADDLAQAYPPAALSAAQSGRATISCTVRADGQLHLCSVVAEEPAGWRFGEAALSLAPMFRLRTNLPDGRPVEGGTVRIPLRFAVPED